MSWNSQMYRFCEAVRSIWPDVASPLIVEGMRARFVTVNMPRELEGENDNERLG